MKYLLALGLLGVASASDTSCRVTLTVDFFEDSDGVIEISKDDGSTQNNGDVSVVFNHGQIVVCEGDTLITTSEDNSAVTIVDNNGVYTNDDIYQNGDGSWTFPSDLTDVDNIDLKITYQDTEKIHYFIPRLSNTYWGAYCVDNISSETLCPPSYCNWDVDTCKAVPTNDTSTSDPGTDCQTLADSNDAAGYIEAQCCSC